MTEAMTSSIPLSASTWSLYASLAEVQIEENEEKMESLGVSEGDAIKYADLYFENLKFTLWLKRQAAVFI